MTRPSKPDPQEKMLPSTARAAVIIEEGDTRVVYVLRPPLVLTTKHEAEPYEIGPHFGVRSTTTTMSLEGELVEGRIWTGDMPTTTEEQKALEQRREEITNG